LGVGVGERERERESPGPMLGSSGGPKARACLPSAGRRVLLSVFTVKTVS
jgi:hypothetical protein